jgi:glycosyltransferase involved in cell wall biosynthesis
MKISIVIPIYNESENILKLLNSIFDQKVKRMEVILIDDGSTDQTKKIIKPYLKRIKYFKIKNSGVARARNIGIKKSNGSIIIFFDGDVILKKNSLNNFIKYFKENKNVNILQGIWNKEFFEKTNYITKHLLLKLDFNFNEIYKKQKKYHTFKGIKVSELATGCLGIRKKIANKFFFNENYKSSGGEEFELGSKISKIYDIYLTPKIKVYHKFEGLFETLRRIFFRTINYSIVYFNLNNEEKKNLNESNGLSVPKRDKNNGFIICSLIFFLILGVFNNIFLTFSIVSFSLFLINNLKFLNHIKNNLNYHSCLKSLIIEFLIIFYKLIAISLAVFIVYILHYKKLKI